MIKKFKNHIEKLFLFYPNTKEVKEFKEELLSILMEKYEDMLNTGASENDAFKSCISSIGEYKETMAELSSHTTKDLTIAGKKLAVIGTLTYVFGVILLYFILSLTIVPWAWSWLTFIGGIIAGAIAIFAQAAIRGSKTSKFIIVRCSNALVICLLTTAIYLITSLALGNMWHLTWIAYLLGFAIAYTFDVLYRAKYKVKSHPALDISLISLLITLVIYFSVSMALVAWAWTWVFFIAWIFVSLLGILIGKIIDFRRLDMEI